MVLALGSITLSEGVTIAGYPRAGSSLYYHCMLNPHELLKERNLRRSKGS